MSTVRYREDESSAGTTIATVLLGAVAGFAVGMYVAQRVGGFGGLAGRLKKRTALDPDEAYYQAAGEDFLEEHEDGDAERGTRNADPGFDWDGDDHADVEDDDAERDAAPMLEERVLEAFNNDPVLSERAIDIGTLGTGAIELEGWVDDDKEAEHAVTIARGVPGVKSVANRLMVDDGTT